AGRMSKPRPAIHPAEPGTPRCCRHRSLPQTPTCRCCPPSHGTVPVPWTTLDSEPQLARPRLDHESTDAARGFSSICRGLVNSIDDALVWMNRQERRILGLSGHADQGDLAGCRIESA